MPAPEPLTACDPPRLDWSRPGTPAATDFGDIYFSVDGGLEETEAVYLQGCGLPERWQGRSRFSIGELGFGSGLNFLAAWRMWEKHKPETGRLHFVSVEKFPFSKDDLVRAFSAWLGLESLAARLIDIWPGPVKGVHRLHVTADVTLTLVHDDVLAGLKNFEGLIDAWFLDGFSPAKNPDMWSEDVMAEVGRLSAPGARVGTFTVAGAVRAALTSAGFAVEKKEGFGRKRHRLEAVYPGSTKEMSAVMKPVILGRGIAGAALARSFLRRGIEPVIIDPDDGTAASGNPAAIVKPRLDLQDRPESRFFLESYLYALRAYEESGAILSRGVFHAARSETEGERFAKLLNHAALPKDHMVWRKGPYDLEGLDFPQGLVIDPKTACRFFAGKTPKLTARAYQVDTEKDVFNVKDKNGQVLATGTHVFAATGAGIRDLMPGFDLPLRYSRGQITSAETGACETMTYGGYAIPLEGSTLLGATHARLTGVDPYEVVDVDDSENIEKFENITGETAGLIPGGSRASIRVTRANTLPLIHKHGDVYTLTALGSRGFVFAPLLAEQLVSRLCNEPRSCLPASLFVSL